MALAEALSSRSVSDTTVQLSQFWPANLLAFLFCKFSLSVGVQLEADQPGRKTVKTRHAKAWTPSGLAAVLIVSHAVPTTPATDFGYFDGSSRCIPAVSGTDRNNMLFTICGIM